MAYSDTQTVASADSTTTQGTIQQDSMGSTPAVARSEFPVDAAILVGALALILGICYLADKLKKKF